MDEQTDAVLFKGDTFAFTVATQFAAKVYKHADNLRAIGKKVILGGTHVTVCPDESLNHTDAIVVGRKPWGHWGQVLLPELFAEGNVYVFGIF